MHFETCKNPVAEGKCPKHGGPKLACCQEHYNDAKASGILRKEVYHMTDDGVAVNRINPDLCAAHLEAWKEILQIKCKETGTDPATLHQWDTGTADAISIFDGPSGMFNKGAQACIRCQRSMRSPRSRTTC